VDQRLFTAHRNGDVSTVTNWGAISPGELCIQPTKQTMAIHGFGCEEEINQNI